VEYWCAVANPYLGWIILMKEWQSKYNLMKTSGESSYSKVIDTIERITAYLDPDNEESALMIH